MSSSRRPSRKRSKPSAKVKPSVYLGLQDFVDGNEDTIASMLSVESSSDLVAALLSVMGINSLSTEQLLARFFNKQMLATYSSSKLQLSAKGSESVLAARIAKSWSKEPPRKKAKVASPKSSNAPIVEDTKTSSSSSTTSSISSTTSSTTSTTIPTTTSTTSTTNSTTNIQAIWNGKILASTTTCEYVEGTIYFPVTSVNQEYIVPNDAFGTTFCHWKGHCNYYDIVVDTQTLVAAMYEYEAPYSQAIRIKDHVAFSNQEIEIKGTGRGCMYHEDFEPKVTDEEADRAASAAVAESTARAVKRVHELKGNQCLLILVGRSGSGKTTWVKKNLSPNSYFEHIHQDYLQNSKETELLTKKALDNGRNVVVDRANLSLEERSKLISLAYDNEINIISLIFGEDETSDTLKKRISSRKNHPKNLPSYVVDQQTNIYVQPESTDVYEIMDLVHHVNDVDNVDNALSVALVEKFGQKKSNICCEWCEA